MTEKDTSETTAGNQDKIQLLSVNAGEKFPDFAGLKFPLSGKKIY